MNRSLLEQRGWSGERGLGWEWRGAHKSLGFIVFFKTWHPESLKSVRPGAQVHSQRFQSHGFRFYGDFVGNVGSIRAPRHPQTKKGTPECLARPRAHVSITGYTQIQASAPGLCESTRRINDLIEVTGVAHKVRRTPPVGQGLSHEARGTPPPWIRRGPWDTP
jgi:hypothetical protein